MKAHMLIHGPRPEKNYECADCGRRYRTKANIRAHINHVHNSKKQKFCADCHIQFRNMTTYNAHMKYSSKHVAAELLRYKCEECPKAFVTRLQLQRHVEGTHRDQRNYPCELCSKKFRSAAACRKHRREVHEGYVAPRDKMCDHCGKAFQTKSVLSSHMNTHTGARPFVCKLCGADFGHKSALYLHGRYKHKIQKIAKNVKKQKDNTGS